MTQMTSDGTQKAPKKGTQKPALNFMLISAGSIFTSMIISGFLVGYTLDTAMVYFFDIKTMPIFLLSCALLGFIGGIKKVQTLLGKMDLLDPQTDSHNAKAKKEATLATQSEKTDAK